MDKVLVQFAIVACATSRRSDVIARIGGEEFLVLMPGCDLADAGRTIDALRQKMLGLSLTAGHRFTALSPPALPPSRGRAWSNC